MCDGIDGWSATRVSRIFISCKEVESEIRQDQEVDSLLGGRKRLVIPKTMVVGNKRDDFRRKALLTSYEYEKYDTGVVAELLGYERSEAGSMTHRGININDLVDRHEGECSIILADSIMEKMDAIIFSQKLSKDLRRKNAVVSYALGNRIFWSMGSYEFMNHYTNLYGDKIREDLTC